MASAFTHAAAALALGTAFRSPGPPARFWVLGALCAALPDLDVLALGVATRGGLRRALSRPPAGTGTAGSRKTAAFSEETIAMTKRCCGTLLVAALVLSVELASCRTAPDKASFDQAQAETEIRDMEHAWAQVAVTGDPTVIERIFAADFLGVSPEGTHYTKRAFIDDTKANPLGFTSNELNDVKVRFFDNVAVAQGDETFTTKDAEKGRFVWTDVLVRRDGRWQIVAAQDVVAPVTGRPASPALFSGPEASAAAQRRIDATRNAYVSAWVAADPVQIAELYAEDALVLYPNQPAVTGRSAIREYFTGFFKDFPKNEFELSSDEIIVLGEWAFDRGTYRWKGFPRAGGAPEEDNGKYLVVLRRKADGQWLVARDMDNSNRPASQATRGTR